VALLRRKKEIVFVPGEKERERRLPAAALRVKRGEAKRKASPGEEKVAEEKPEAAPAERPSTTERLLAIKKKWKKDKK